MVGFFVPGEDESGDEISLELPHLRAPAPPWWSEIAATVPTLGADSSSEVWRGPRYDVITHYDTSGDFATLVVRDSAKREWSVGRLPTPARRVYRLDTPDVDSVARRGLARAFDESTLYSGSARTVTHPLRAHARPRLILTSWSPYPTRHQRMRSPSPTFRPRAHRLDRR